MLSQTAQILERFIAISINTKYPTTPPDEETFLSEANTIRSTMSVSDEEFQQVLKNLKAAMQISMDVGVFISDQSNDHQSWLPSRRAEIDFYYWNRYKRYLEEVQGWNSRVTANLDTVSTDIVDLLGDPWGKVMPEDALIGIVSEDELSNVLTLGMSLNYQKNSYTLWQSIA
jgi:glycerophosphoryl diester phosphodiesterase